MKNIRHQVEENYFTQTYFGVEDGRDYITVSVRCPLELAKDYAAAVLKCKAEDIKVISGFWYADDEDLYDKDPKIPCSRVQVFYRG